MGEIHKEKGAGWLPDVPDHRDYTHEHGAIAPLLQAANLADPNKVALPATMDLREWFPPIEDQGKINSCTAHAVTGLAAYYQNRAYGTYLEGSRLFLYKVSRDLLGWTDDKGAHTRTAMCALALFGAPPEKYWPYDPESVNKEPTAFCYAFAQNYQAMQYYRLDPPNTPTDQLLGQIKSHLASGLPMAFGFSVYWGVSLAQVTGQIPYPSPIEKQLNGHAVVAVGYDDTLKIMNTMPKGIETTGALLIRNSWGTEWGDKGYGWLPYEYVLNGLAVDWWVLLKEDWVDLGMFGL